MIADFINPLVTASISVLKQVLPGTPIKQGELAIKRELSFECDQVTYLDVSGEIQGKILFEMNIETEIKLAEIMNDCHFNEYNQMVKATINELANMISGKMISHLRERGRDFNISTPKKTEANKISEASFSKVLTVPIVTSAGNLSITVIV